MTGPRDDWAVGDLYEPYVGRWSRPVALEFLAWLDVPDGRDWVDVGSGTGALTEVIVRTAPRSVVGVDRSADFVAYANDRIGSSIASFRTGDAQDLPLADDSVDAAVSGLVLNFVPDQARAVAEMSRVTRPDGVVAVYVWDYTGEMQMMRIFWDAAVELDRSAVEHDEGPRFPVCNPEALHELFTGAGLRDVETRAIDVPTRFADFDDYWTPFLGGHFPAPAYAMSLSEDARAELRERTRSKLPVADDGSIELIARAFAVRGSAG
jgi:SAM-dependent methyltransferase